MSRNIIFLRVPRCGSASLTQWCQKNQIVDIYGGRDVGFWGPKLETYTIENLFAHLKDESLSKRVERKLGFQYYRDSFKFTSVRNPYARAVSIWRHSSWSECESFAYFCDNLYRKKYPSRIAKWHAMVISDHIFVEGDLKVDIVLKLESIESDLARLAASCCRNLIPYRNKPIDNSRAEGTVLSAGKNFAQMYTPELAQMISYVYERDFVSFGYSKNIELT